MKKMIFLIFLHRCLAERRVVAAAPDKVRGQDYKAELHLHLESAYTTHQQT